MARLFILAIQVHRKKIQNDSDIFDVVMTSSFFADDVISDDFDDVITTSKMSESFWIFVCVLLWSKWTIVQIFTNIVTFVLFYFTRLWDNEGSTTALFEVMWHHIRNVFSSFFSPKVRKRHFHNISNRFLIEIQWKYEKTSARCYVSRQIS